MNSKFPSVADLIRNHSKARYLMINREQGGTQPAGDSAWVAQAVRELMVKKYG